MRIAASLSALLIVFPAGAQETTFTPEDAKLMTECIEGLAASNNAESDFADVQPQTQCIGAASNICMQTDYSTLGMTECMGRETDWWDSQLNVHYASLEESLEPSLFTSLQQAQRAWIAFRDASCGFEYELWSEGTIRSIVGASCMLELTAQRADALSGYVNRTP